MLVLRRDMVFLLMPRNATIQKRVVTLGLAVVTARPSLRRITSLNAKRTLIFRTCPPQSANSLVRAKDQELNKDHGNSRWRLDTKRKRSSRMGEIGMVS